MGAGQPRFIVLEVKQSTLYEPPESDTRVKSAAAMRWCEAQSTDNDVQWEYWLLLDSDIEKANTVADLQRVSVSNPGVDE